MAGFALIRYAKDICESKIGSALTAFIPQRTIATCQQFAALTDELTQSFYFVVTQRRLIRQDQQRIGDKFLLVKIIKAHEIKLVMAVQHCLQERFRAVLCMYPP